MGEDFGGQDVEDVTPNDAPDLPTPPATPLDQGSAFQQLVSTVSAASAEVQAKLAELQQQPTDGISIGDMLEMQMLMNQLTQLSEITSNLAAASNEAIAAIARNMKT